MTGQASKRWLVHLPQTAYNIACQHYGGDDKVRDLLCESLADVLKMLDNGTLSTKQLSDHLTLSVPPIGELTVLVSLRVPLDTNHNFDALLGVYGAKTAIMREILTALLTTNVPEVYTDFVNTRRALLVDTFGGSRNVSN